jgi:hypothetical protein
LGHLAIAGPRLSRCAAIFCGLLLNLVLCHGGRTQMAAAPSGGVAARPGGAEVPIAPAGWTGAVGQVSGIDASGQ